MEEPGNSQKRGRRRRAPATTPEARENQLISLSYDVAEKQLEEGTASAMVLTHFLKLGTARARLEEKKLEQENILLAARTEALENSTKIEELYSKALKAMSDYQGMVSEDEEYED